MQVEHTQMLSQEVQMHPQQAQDSGSFYCPDCSLNKPNEMCYIAKFAKASEAVNVDDEPSSSAAQCEIVTVRKSRKAPPQEGDDVRCIPCHNVRSRIGGVIKKRGWGMEWGCVDKVKKKQVHAGLL